MKVKIYLINILIFFFLFKDNLCEKEETCEQNENDEYKIIYDDYFLNTEKDIDFDFKLNEKVIDYIKRNTMITYPKKLFRGSPQGNFLHFIHLIYNKKLPLYFPLIKFYILI